MRSTPQLPNLTGASSLPTDLQAWYSWWFFGQLLLFFKGLHRGWDLLVAWVFCLSPLTHYCPYQAFVIEQFLNVLKDLRLSDFFSANPRGHGQHLWANPFTQRGHVCVIGRLTCRSSSFGRHGLRFDQLTCPHFGDGSAAALGFLFFAEEAAKTKPIGGSLEHVTLVRTCAIVRANLRLYLSENSVLLILIPLNMVSSASCWCSCWWLLLLKLLRRDSDFHPVFVEKLIDRITHEAYSAHVNVCYHGSLDHLFQHGCAQHDGLGWLLPMHVSVARHLMSVQDQAQG